MKYKSILASTAHAKLRVRTLGLLAGVAAIAATAGPAAAQLALFRSRRERLMISRAGCSLRSTSASPTR